MTSSPEPAPDRRRYLGLDLGGTNIKVAVIEERDAGLPLVVCMVLGTGVGGGIVVDGRLLGGPGAGEIGHQTVLLDGPRCGCGNRGCVEALTRADVFARRGGRATPKEVYAAARAGDPVACAAVEHVVGWLSVALANAYALLAPDAFVVGGGVAAAGDLLLGPLEEAVRRRVFLAPPERVRVLAAALGPYAGAAGAALRGREAAREALNTASIA
jgi:glucokinase